jgi:glycogen debranching enzyme
LAKTFRARAEVAGEKFWNSSAAVFDVIDVNHRANEKDAAFRPNQIFAVGGLPFQLIEGERAEKIVAVVGEKLRTPLGLRSLAPGEPDYKPQYEGGVWQRDGAYHQGTVWPWLIGPFVEAWVRVRGSTSAAKQEARARFLTPLLVHLDEADRPFPKSLTDAPIRLAAAVQAWSVGVSPRPTRSRNQT